MANQPPHILYIITTTEDKILHHILWNQQQHPSALFAVVAMNPTVDKWLQEQKVECSLVHGSEQFTLNRLEAFLRIMEGPIFQRARLFFELVESFFSAVPYFMWPLAILAGFAIIKLLNYLYTFLVTESANRAILFVCEELIILFGKHDLTEANILTKEQRHRLLEDLGWKLTPVKKASFWQGLTNTRIVNLEGQECLLVAQK